jgi:hypothetical protein
MTLNGPPKPSQETLPADIEAPEYWKDNPPFKSPKKYFELQFEFAKLMAERTGMPLAESVKAYAPILEKSIHTLDAEGNELAPLEGLTDENMFEVGYAMAQERRAQAKSEGETIPYRDERGDRFGCSSYDYEEDTKTVRVHFFNAEADEEWVDGKDISKGPLSVEKADRRRHELTQMFRDIMEKHPDAKHVRGCSNLYNLESYRRIYPDTYEVGDIDYDPKRWSRGMAIWGQFLGGKDKVPGEYGFRQDLADEFLEKAKEVPLDRLADALPMPPRAAHGDIQDFYDLYGIT